MAAQANYNQNQSRNRFTRRKFVSYFIILIVISTKVGKVTSKTSAHGKDQPGTFEDELPSATDDDEDKLQQQSNTTTTPEEVDVLRKDSDWLLLLPYLPVVGLIALCSWCHSCGNKQVQAQRRRVRQPTTTVEEPAYSTSPPDYYSVVAPENVGVWTVQGHISIIMPDYEITSEKEEEPPAYDTLFEVKKEIDTISLNTAITDTVINMDIVSKEKEEENDKMKGEV